MTIKRRLFISNILMIVIPIILSTGIFAVAASIFFGVTDMDYSELPHPGGAREAFEKYFYLVILAYLLVIAVILLTNRVLVKFMVRSVVTPIDTLVYGVHQVRDGNMQYRIDYDRKDEFSGICADFNEMAQHLSDFVTQQQRDEQNRKELIAGISHDLRTPLTGIKAYVEGLEKGIAQNPETQKKYLKTIKSKTMELERIINQLFLFSKIDIGEFPFNLEKVDISAEIGNIVDSIRDEYEKNGLTISDRASEDAVYANADIQQLHNAVINIFENSLKYKTEGHGILDIITYADDKAITIELKDDGPGVAEDALDKLFDVFYRCDPSRTGEQSGSGLGLAITAEILERLGGSIKAKNVSEGGLAIIITLPVLKGDHHE